MRKRERVTVARIVIGCLLLATCQTIFCGGSDNAARPEPAASAPAPAAAPTPVAPARAAAVEPARPVPPCDRISVCQGLCGPSDGTKKGAAARRECLDRCADEPGQICAGRGDDCSCHMDPHHRPRSSKAKSSTASGTNIDALHERSVRQHKTEAPAPSSSGTCCKHCGPNSQPCGNSCISLSKTCHKGRGCAC